LRSRKAGATAQPPPASGRGVEERHLNFLPDVQ
jgi:hypothetical protein